MTRNVEQLFIYVVYVCVSSSEKCLLICLYNFKVFFHFRAVCAHNNSDRRPLSNTWLGKSFPSAVLFLTCLMESLDKQELKFFILWYARYYFLPSLILLKLNLKTSLTNSRSWIFSSLFYSKSYVVLSLIFQSLIHFCVVHF